MSGPGVREARLRPAHAKLYPGIEPNVWFTAATLAEHLHLRRLREGEVDAAGTPRPLSPEHFDFRGGERPIGMRAVLGRRPGD
ncbi:MAG: hypothetical protein H0T50_00395 [Gemmatimonadales bacterium]|nr:hypothetical protein [Gemmatimonadales bacterium]